MSQIIEGLDRPVNIRRRHHEMESHHGRELLEKIERSKEDLSLRKVAGFKMFSLRQMNCLAFDVRLPQGCHAFSRPGRESSL